METKVYSKVADLKSVIKSRQARVDEAEELTNLINSAYTSNKAWIKNKDFMAVDQRINVDEVTKMLNDDMQLFLISENLSERRIIGCISLSIREDHPYFVNLNSFVGDGKKFWLNMLSILPEYQSKGVGNVLLTLAINFFKDCHKLETDLSQIESFLEKYDANKNFVEKNLLFFRKIDKIVINTFSNLQALMSFYKRLGFKETGYRIKISQLKNPKITGPDSVVVMYYTL